MPNTLLALFQNCVTHHCPLDHSLNQLYLVIISSLCNPCIEPSPCLGRLKWKREERCTTPYHAGHLWHLSLWPPSQPIFLSWSISAAQGTPPYPALARQATTLARTRASKTLPAHASTRAHRALATSVRRALECDRPPLHQLRLRRASTRHPLHARQRR